MKDKIIMLIIGILVGAVLATGAFYVYSITAGKCDCSSQTTQTNGNQPPSKPDGEPPEKPNGESGEPPAKPSDDNSKSNTTKSSNN